MNQEACCEPDYDYEKGQYVHQTGCFGSVEANEEANEVDHIIEIDGAMYAVEFKGISKGES